MEEQRRNWAAPAVLIGLITLAAVQGPSALILGLPAVPVIAAVLAYTSGWMGVAGVCAATVIALGVITRMVPWATAIWCGLSAGIACLPLKRPRTRPLLWAGLCLGGWIAGIAVLSNLFEGQLVHGLAQSMCDMIAQSPQRDTILLNAYSMGLSRLEADARLSQMSFLLMPAEMRNQLLFSLRVSLEEALPAALCEGLVYHTALTTLLCVTLPDWRRRRNGEKGLYPPMEKWYIPRGMGLAVGSLCFGWLLSTMSSGGADLYLGLLMSAVFQAAFLLQGICLLQWVEKRMGIRSTMRTVWAVALSLLAPIVPILMGLIDQRKDARHLRPDEEAESL